MYKWIHGQSLPSIDNLLILAKLLGSTVEGILATSGDALPHSKGNISMDENNFIQLDYLSFLNDAYMYMDTKDHLADQIFIRHKLPVRFKGDYRKEDGARIRIPFSPLLTKRPLLCHSRYPAIKVAFGRWRRIRS